MKLYTLLKYLKDSNMYISFGMSGKLYVTVHKHISNVVFDKILKSGFKISSARTMPRDLILFTFTPKNQKLTNEVIKVWSKTDSGQKRLIGDE